MKYFEVTVAFEIVNDKDKTKIVREKYLVEADSVTASEARVYTFLQNSTENFQVVLSRESKISNVLEVL